LYSDDTSGVKRSGEYYVSKLLLGSELVEERLIQELHHDGVGQFVFHVCWDSDFVVGHCTVVLVGFILKTLLDMEGMALFNCSGPDPS